MPDKHLKYGGSTMARTMNCPSWQKLSEDVPRGGSSSFADEGTLLHNCAEKYFMEDDVDLQAMVGVEEYEGIVLTQELLDDKLIPAINDMNALMDKFDIVDYDCEPFVMFDDTGLAGGSIDLIGVSGDGKTVLIADYKFGFNAVSVMNNDQLRFYAAAADFDKLTSAMFDKAEKAVVAIVQPTTENGYEYDGIDLVDLDEWVIKAQSAIRISEGSDGTNPNPGDWCAYCPAAGVCPAKTGAVVKALRLNATDLATLTAAMPMTYQLEAWIKDVRKLAHEQLEAGVPVEGFKLVNKRASRVWNDVDAVTRKAKGIKKLKQADFSETKLMSPAQLEKSCKRLDVDFKKFGDMISSVSSGTTVAKATDTRPDATPTAAIKALADRLS